MYHAIAKLSCAVLATIAFSSCKTVNNKKTEYIADTRSNYEGDSAQAQILRSGLKWNIGWTSRNLSTLFEMFAPDAQFASAGAKWCSKEDGFTKFSKLLKNRPDIQWVIRPKEIIINENWQVAHATGDWTEWWGESDGIVTLRGTYVFIWKKNKDEPWLVHSAIFTPLRCIGAQYCAPHEK